jgi:hypothetical protein
MCGIGEKQLSFTEYEINLLLSLVDREIRESYSYLERNKGYLHPHDVLRKEKNLKATESLMFKLEQLIGITT